MACIRTIESEIVIVSRKSARSGLLNFEELGFLTFCLTNSNEWEFHPSLIRKQRNCSKNKIYKLFNALIEAGHCIRIKEPNLKHPQLAGKVSYEVFDDIEMCKKYYEEYLRNGVNPKYLEASSSFQKTQKNEPTSTFDRLPHFRELENRDLYFGDNKEEKYKEEKYIRKTTTKRATKSEHVETHIDDVVVFSEKDCILNEIESLKPSDKQHLKAKSTPKQLEKAVAVLKQSKTYVKNPAAYIAKAIEKDFEPADTRTEQDRFADEYNAKLKTLKCNEMIKSNAEMLKNCTMRVFENGHLTQISLKRESLLDSDMIRYMREIDEYIDRMQTNINKPTAKIRTEKPIEAG